MINECPLALHPCRHYDAVFNSRSSLKFCAAGCPFGIRIPYSMIRFTWYPENGQNSLTSSPNYFRALKKIFHPCSSYFFIPFCHTEFCLSTCAGTPNPQTLLPWLETVGLTRGHQHHAWVQRRESDVRLYTCFVSSSLESFPLLVIFAIDDNNSFFWEKVRHFNRHLHVLFGDETNCLGDASFLDNPHFQKRKDQWNQTNEGI